MTRRVVVVNLSNYKDEDYILEVVDADGLRASKLLQPGDIYELINNQDEGFNINGQPIDRVSRDHSYNPLRLEVKPME